MTAKRHRVIVVEDEEVGRKLLVSLIREFCPELDVVGQSGQIEEARSLIIKLQPDLVFFDIKMPGGNAFDVIRSLENVNFQVIFTTAFGEYAMEAFKIAAIDYLLKPIEPEALVRAVERFNQNRKAHSLQEQLTRLLSELNRPQNPTSALSFPVTDGVAFFSPEEILRFEGDGSYTNLVLKDGQTELLSRNIGSIEKTVVDYGFFRVHNSYIVNLRHITKYIRNDAGYLVMSDGKKVMISRRRKEAFLQVMNDPNTLKLIRS